MKSEITNHNSKIRISLLSVLAIWMSLSPLLAKWLVVEKSVERPDAILVLAGGSAFRERTRIAAGFFEQGVAPRVILTNDGEQSGWDQSEKRNPFNFERAKRELTAAGVPESAIDVLPGAVGSTRDEAIAVKNLNGDRRWKRILIVTSAHHTRRALRVFGITASEIEFGITSAPPESVWFWWLSPKGWRDIGIEYVKLGYYWVSY